VIASELVLVLVSTVIACLKGKVMMALLGLLVPVLSLVGAIRLARPRSPWARWRYPAGSARLAKAEKRAQGFDRRWGRPARRLQDFIAGAPSVGSGTEGTPAAAGTKGVPAAATAPTSDGGPGAG
jgi:lysyl-tRNA synthetase class 2